MLAGQYPSDEFAELRPRVVWDRVAGTVRGRSESRVVAVISGGTIPDRGLFGVYLDAGPGEGIGRERVVEAAERPAGGSGARARGGRRVGELDEEMVYETRAGEVILLGASAWRITQITPIASWSSRLPGSRARCRSGRATARAVRWSSDGRSARSRGDCDEESRGARGRERVLARLAAENDLDRPAGENLIAYVDEQADASGALPTDRTIVVERFRDELGDWRDLRPDAVRRTRARSVGARDRGAAA